MAATPRYRAAPPETLRTVTLDLVLAIYHRPSGSTHLVASPVPEILVELRDTALSEAELLERLSIRYALADPDQDALTARLAEMSAAGLLTEA